MVKEQEQVDNSRLVAEYNLALNFPQKSTRDAPQVPITQRSTFNSSLTPHHYNTPQLTV